MPIETGNNPEFNPGKEKPLVPEVKSEVLNLMLTELRKVKEAGNSGEYIRDIIERIDQSNPRLSVFITEFTKGWDAEHRNDSIELVAQIYRLLEIQMEADRDMDTLSQSDIE